MLADKAATNMSQEQTYEVRPILRWAGSKRKLLRRLKGFWNNTYDRYVEPFAGSCCLFFAIAPNDALLADKNSELIETYEVLSDHADDLYKEVRSYPSNAKTYYKLRSINAQSLSRLKRAARFVYLNRNCFNGLYRTNRKGQFNVPYGSSRAGALPTLEEFRACARQLMNASIRAWDFGTTLRYVRKNDFVYLDPPYAVKSRRIFREYGPKYFGAEDLERLFDHLDRIDGRGAKFVLSYADCREIRALGAKWDMRRVSVRRHIAGFTGSRRRAYEFLVTNT